MDNLTESVAKNVTAAIDSAGQTQVSISEATGIPRTTLIRRLAGHSPFTIAELGRIAEVLDVEVDDLLRKTAA